MGGVTTFFSTAAKSLLGPAGMLISKEKSKTAKSETPVATTPTKPGGTSQTEKTITTASKDFYAGMTLDEAKQKKLDKSIFSRDFSDIDKDKDGKLSDIEILQERKVEADRINRFSFGVMGSGTVAAAIPGGQIAGLGLAAVGFAIGTESDKINEQSAEYAKKHNIDMDF